MGSEVIKQLLEKYWQAETSLEEERILTEYFRGQDVAEELESYRSLFDWIGEEAALTAPLGLQERILQQIGTSEPMADEKERQGGYHLNAGRHVERRMPARGMRYAAAAALLLCVVSTFLVARIGGRTTTEPDPGIAQHSGIPAGQHPAPQPSIKDTYDDPEKALAVVRQALLRVSVSMNEGRRITQKNMRLMDHSWQAAVSH